VIETSSRWGVSFWEGKINTGLSDTVGLFLVLHTSGERSRRGDEDEKIAPLIGGERDGQVLLRNAKQREKNNMV